jgi:methyltransferase family protein
VRAISRLTRTARAVAAVTARPPFVPPGHFYSPLTSSADARRALARDGSAPGGVNLREREQLTLAAHFRPVLEAPLPGPRYRPGNQMYSTGDAAVYRAMLQYLRPAKIIEAGSGYSTAIALDEAGADPAFADLAVSCIEPYPDRLLGLLRPGDRERLTLLRQPVQDVPVPVYRTLRAGDILFVDSTHVVKPGSDVVWLVLDVFPRLAAGVVVHVHDMFWPFTYPDAWLREHRDWTEAYLVQAFLSGNSDWEILLFSSWLWHRHPEAVPPHLLRDTYPGSLWLRKIR